MTIPLNILVSLYATAHEVITTDIVITNNNNSSGKANSAHYPLHDENVTFWYILEHYPTMTCTFFKYLQALRESNKRVLANNPEKRA